MMRTIETLYLSGRMSGLPNYNRDRFNEIEYLVRELGYDVVNPAQIDLDEDGPDVVHTWEHYIKRDLSIIIEKCDGIVMFDDWQNSRGATLELYVAKQIGLKVYGIDTYNCKLIDGVDLPAPFEAKDIVLGARRYTYGHPADNFDFIAGLWQATIGHKLKDGESVDLRDVAMMMLQVKVAREYNAPKRDNIVDIIGYAYAYQESIEETARRNEERSK
jgi:hypothetical protein